MMGFKSAKFKLKLYMERITCFIHNGSMKITILMHKISKSAKKVVNNPHKNEIYFKEQKLPK